MRKEANLHSDLGLLLTGVLETYKGYTGGNPRLIRLKNDAEILLNGRFYRKNYSV